MKKFVLLFGIAALGLMASCENTIRYEYDRNDGQITMLSQMYTSDTEHTVYLSMSYPDRVDSLPGATVVCWVNGEKYVAEEQPVPMEEYYNPGPYLETRTDPVVLRRRHQLFNEYVFPATLRPGDEVRVEASKGSQKVWAQVTVPQPAELVQVDTQRVVRSLSYVDIDGSDSYDEAFMEMAVKIRDVPGDDSYFMLAGDYLMEGEFQRHDESGAVDSTAYYRQWNREIDYQTFHDAILEDGYSAGGVNSLLEDILVTNQMHCFSDKEFRDGEAVVRPFFDADYFIWRDYGYQWICPGTDEGDLHASFNLHLRTISRDFYNYLRALNNLQTYGYDVIPIIEPTILPNNVTGGYGLVSVGADRTVTFDLGTRHIVHDASEGLYYGY